MPGQKKTGDFFNEQVSQGYDERARRIGAINDNIHLLTRLALKDLPHDARILCVGVGTGSEIIALAGEHEGWSFVGLDPSASMLKVCRARLEEGGLLPRVALVHGYLTDLRKDKPFDAVLCFLVTHFILDDGERQSIYADMHGRLKSGGYLVHTDISFDAEAPEFAAMLETWKEMHILSGATPEQAENIPKTLKENVAVRSPEFIKGLLRKSGFPKPVQFVQSLLIHGWYSQKP